MADESVNAALAVTKDDMAALSPTQRAALAMRKNANIVSAQIAGTNWGKGLDAATQRAVSDWGARNGIDVTTEIFVLGGNIYLNAQMYINRGVQLIQAGKVLDYRQRFINPDSRLDPNDPADAAELRERRQLRIKYNVPDAAPAAVLTEIVLTRMPHAPIIGVKWCPHPNSKSPDPVGKDYPQETALTRSARRAWKQAAAYLPEVAKFVVGAEEDAEATVEHLLESHQQRELKKAEERSLAQLGAGAQGQPETRQHLVGEAEYVVDGARGARGVEGTQIAQRYAAMPDPYVTPGTEHIETPFDTDAIPEGPNGPVTENLFGEHAAMEPTADERAQAAEEEEARIRAEEVAMLAEEEKRREQRIEQGRGRRR